MSDTTAYLNGRLVPLAEVSVAITDTGFVLGAAASEQLRTFAGTVFRLDDHLARFGRSLEIVGLSDRVSIDAVRGAVEHVVATNYPLVMADDVDDAADLGVSLFATPGPYPGLADTAAACEPTVCVHTFRLPFHLWADRYEKGQPLATTNVVQVSPRCWPRELKCRSRMHYYLADRRAAETDPGARALLLDEAGFVNETATANVVAVFGSELVTPPSGDVLHGISLAVVKELSAEAGFAWIERPLRLEELAAADEILLTSTPYCLLPCCRLNARAVGRGTPGDVFKRLLASWSEHVGLDIAEQAKRGADRAGRKDG